MPQSRGTVGLALAIATTLLFAAGCTCDGPAEGTVMSVVGLVNLQPVAVDEPLLVELTHAFELDTAHAELLPLTPDAAVVSCTCAHDPRDPTTLLVHPDEPLRHDTDYRLTIWAYLDGPDCTEMPYDAILEFRTETEHPPVPAGETVPFAVMRHGVDLSALWQSDQGGIEAGVGGFVLVRPRDAMHGWILPTGIDQRINDVWCSGTGRVYLAYGNGPASGGGVLLYTDGVPSVLETTSEAVTGIWGLAETHVLATHGSSVLEVAPDETREHMVPDSAALDVWAVREGAEDVAWVAGAAGIYRGDASSTGRSWTRVLATDDPVVAIAGIDASTVCAVGRGAIYWPLDSGSPVRPSPDNDWLAVALHADAPLPVSGIMPPFAVGTRIASGNTLLMGPWWGADRGQTVSGPNLLAIHAWAPDQAAVWIEAVGRLGRRLRAEATVHVVEEHEDPLKRDHDPAGDWTSLSGLADGTLFGVRAGELFAYVSLEWREQTRPEGLALSHAHAEAWDSLFAVGTDATGIDRFGAYWDGSEWSTWWMSSMDEPRDLWGIREMRDGTPRVRLFVACDFGLVYVLGDTWAPTNVFRPGTTTGEHLRGVWGTSSDSVWVVGENGLIAHYTNPEAEPVGFWTAVDPAPTSRHLRDVHGTGESHILAVGDDGTILRFDGATWSPLSPGIDLSGVDLATVWTGGEDDIWAASADGVVVRYDGIAWQRWTVPIPGIHLRGVANAGAQGVWFGGDADLLLRHETRRYIPLIDGD